MIDEYSIIPLLRYLNALDKKRSVRPNELAVFLKKEASSIYEILSKLSQDRKVFFWMIKFGLLQRVSLCV
jgi:hypothetical protein